MKRKVTRVLALFAAVAALWVAVFFGARYGWPGAFPESFIGCHAEVIDGALYVGFKYNKLLGVWIYDKGDFQITIPVEQSINAVYMKAGDTEYQIWPEQDIEGDTK